MVTGYMAHSVFSVPRKIARLRAQSYLTAIYSDLYRRDHVPIDVVISPEKEVAEALHRLNAPWISRYRRFPGGQVQLLGLLLDEDCAVLNALAPVDGLVFDPAGHRCWGASRRDAFCA